MPSTSWSGLDLEATADKMQLPADLALGFHVAAVRETFEEVGILLADQGSAARDSGPSLREMRRSLHAGNDDWAESLERTGLRLDLGALRWWSWWITPPSLPRRYNTRFFAAECPASPVLTDSREVEETVWTNPASALRRAARGAWYVMRPTITTLNELTGHHSVSAALNAAEHHHAARRSQPRP
jgi:8-oxo-dGTP pyrophosphatase MutT (NUDIX family)